MMLGNVRYAVRGDYNRLTFDISEYMDLVRRDKADDHSFTSETSVMSPTTNTIMDVDLLGRWKVVVDNKGHL